MRRAFSVTLLLSGTLLLAGAPGLGCNWETRDLGKVACGNNICDSGETPVTCAEDCDSGTCGNNLCELTEDSSSCPEDCSENHCGNGTCGDKENVYTCPGDCPWNSCGNGVCEAGEEDGVCAKDCFVPTCGNGLCELSETPADCASDCPMTTQVDLLFVVDDSGSMADEQSTLSQTLPTLYEYIRLASGPIPDLHVGVMSTDLGSGNFPISYCEDGGDQGNLLAPTGAGLQGVPFMIDEEPQHCDVTRDSRGHCTAYTCDADPCDTSDGTHVGLVEDPDTGCPRCRNFADAPDSVFRALASPGTMGCGFEQPLESMYRALDNNPHNDSFLRQGALLAVVFVTDEDDCSASNPNLFDNTQTDINDTLGPLTSYRCFEFGVTCDIDSRTAQGLRQECRPRDDSAALLYPIQRYRDLLLGLKEPGRIVVMALAGPVTMNNQGVSVMVGLDEYSQPELQTSCSSERGGAVPAIRLHSFVQYFNGGADMDTAYRSICDSEYNQTAETLGLTLRRRMQF